MVQCLSFLRLLSRYGNTRPNLHFFQYIGIKASYQPKWCGQTACQHQGADEASLWIMMCLFKAWGYASPHGLFKRGKDLAEDYQNEEIMQLLEEVGEQLNT